MGAKVLVKGASGNYWIPINEGESVEQAKARGQQYVKDIDSGKKDLKQVNREIQNPDYYSGKKDGNAYLENAGLEKKGGYLVSNQNGALTKQNYSEGPGSPGIDYPDQPKKGTYSEGPGSKNIPYPEVTKQDSGGGPQNVIKENQDRGVPTAQGIVYEQGKRLERAADNNPNPVKASFQRGMSEVFKTGSGLVGFGEEFLYSAGNILFGTNKQGTGIFYEQQLATLRAERGGIASEQPAAQDLRETAGVVTDLFFLRDLGQFLKNPNTVEIGQVETFSVSTQGKRGVSGVAEFSGDAIKNTGGKIPLKGSVVYTAKETSLSGESLIQLDRGLVISGEDVLKIGSKEGLSYSQKINKKEFGLSFYSDNKIVSSTKVKVSGFKDGVKYELRSGKEILIKPQKSYDFPGFVKKPASIEGVENFRDTSISVPGKETPKNLGSRGAGSTRNVINDLVENYAQAQKVQSKTPAINRKTLKDSIKSGVLENIKQDSLSAQKVGLEAGLIPKSWLGVYDIPGVDYSSAKEASLEPSNPVNSPGFSSFPRGISRSSLKEALTRVRGGKESAPYQRVDFKSRSNLRTALKDINLAKEDDQTKTLQPSVNLKEGEYALSGVEIGLRDTLIVGSKVNYPNPRTLLKGSPRTSTNFGFGFPRPPDFVGVPGSNFKGGRGFENKKRKSSGRKSESEENVSYAPDVFSVLLNLRGEITQKKFTGAELRLIPKK